MGFTEGGLYLIVMWTIPLSARLMCNTNYGATINNCKINQTCEAFALNLRHIIVVCALLASRGTCNVDVATFDTDFSGY